MEGSWEGQGRAVRFSKWNYFGPSFKPRVLHSVTLYLHHTKTPS